MKMQIIEIEENQPIAAKGFAEEIKEPWTWVYFPVTNIALYAQKHKKKPTVYRHLGKNYYYRKATKTLKVAPYYNPPREQWFTKCRILKIDKQT